MRVVGLGSLPGVLLGNSIPPPARPRLISVPAHAALSRCHVSLFGGLFSDGGQTESYSYEYWTALLQRFHWHCTVRGTVLHGTVGVISTATCRWSCHVVITYRERLQYSYSYSTVQYSAWSNNRPSGLQVSIRISTARDISKDRGNNYEYITILPIQ